MSKVSRALKKLKNSKSAADSMRILAELKAKDPKTYEAIQKLPGN